VITQAINPNNRLPGIVPHTRAPETPRCGINLPLMSDPRAAIRSRRVANRLAAAGVCRARIAKWRFAPAYRASGALGAAGAAGDAGAGLGAAGAGVGAAGDAGAPGVSGEPGNGPP